MTEPQQPTPDGSAPPPPQPGAWQQPAAPQPGAWQQPAAPQPGAWQQSPAPGVPQQGAWQQPPAQQPGWQPGPPQGQWGQPGQPYAQPGGWGPAPGQVGWPPPSPPRRSRKPWVIGCLVLFLLLVIGVGSCTVFFARSFGVAGSVLAASNGQIDGFRANSFNGRTSIVFTAARGIDIADGQRIACTAIVPTLRNAGADDDWVLVNRAGDVIASKSNTSCP